MSKVKFDFNTTLKKNIMLLEFVGLWPSDNSTLTRRSYLIYSSVVIVFFTLLDQLSMFMNISVSAGDMEQFSSFLTVLSQKTIAVVKLIFFLVNMDINKLLMEQLNSEDFLSQNERQHRLMEKSMRIFNKLFKFYFSLCTLTVVMFLMSPILMNERKMPFDQWYPYVYNTSPWFEITYLHQIIGTLLNSSTNVGVDTFSVGLMVILGSQCELLEDKFLNFRELLQKHDSAIGGSQLNQEDYNEIFKKLVQHHQQILLFSKRLNKMFNYYTFIQMALCILLFCTAMYRLSIVEFDNLDFLPILAFIGTISVQLFLYCWFGNEVKYKSSKLHMAAYKCDWVGSPISFQKKLCVFMRRTKDPIEIYALSFFPLNTVTFTSVMRSSWSIFLLLRQLNE